MHGFIKFLSEHRGGATHEELTSELQELVAAVADEGKAGSITLTIGIKPLAKGDGLEVSASVNSKPPKAAAGVSIFYATPGNDLTRQDPRQQSMELREVPAAAAARSLA